MAPEILSGTLSGKTDVYSFGILLLEIVSGRKNNDQFDSLSEDGSTIKIGIGAYVSIFHFISCPMFPFPSTILRTKINWIINQARRLWGERRTAELVDPMLITDSQEPIALMLRCIHVALLCIQNQAEHRPKMSDVTHMLSDKSNSLPNPIPPSAFCVIQQDDTGKPESSSSYASL